MKTTKTILLIVLFLCFTFSIMQAQQAYQIHQDNVKPSKFIEYEKIAKEFNAACIEHNVQTTWYVAMSNDFKYFYISPIENFADLDKRPMAEMAKSMGDKLGDMFNRFDKCYDSHGTYIVIRDNELSYMPEGVSEASENENFRKWFYIYYTPENKKTIRDGMKAVKELFANKGSKQYYRVYRNGLGQMENYYMVSIAAKDEIESAQNEKTNKEVLGPDRWETFKKVMNYASRTEEYTGEMRPDLFYIPKTE